MSYRNIYLRIGLLLVLVVVLCACTEKDPSSNKTTEKKTVSGKVVKYGLFELVRGGLVKDARTSTGKSFSKPVLNQLNSLNRIAAKKDAYMAYQYRIRDLSENAWVDLRRVLIHPEMQLPDGTKSTGSDFTIKRRVEYGQVIAYDGYGLNEDYELVQGEWLFQIWHKDKKLVEQKFYTYIQ
jgi:hypothetical protein